MAAILRRFRKDRSGATAIEYGMILVCLSLVIVGGISAATNSMVDMFTNPARALHKTLNH